ncbi:pheromone A receptor-domain-containing protein [Amylostereum chailletii]|nr:pheromone A receptor-domain-containing protein [Amylostereum chailletii]
MDPTYPLVPIVSIFAAFLILFTVVTALRRSRNTGALVLCMWLFLECTIQGVEAIIWADNVNDKAPVWCDISTHLLLAALVGVPACSLVITRQLYNTIHLTTLTLSRRERRIQCFLDLLLGIGVPVIVAGPFYYIVQPRRFDIVEEIGCRGYTIDSGLTIFLIEIWPVILPLISAIFYCPRIVWTFYRHKKEVERSFRNNGHVNRTGYFRILAIGCLDILFTLPTGALLLISLEGHPPKFAGRYPFYPGWHAVHADWTPASTTAAAWRSEFWVHFQSILQEWQYPVLSVLIFSIFCSTREALGTYRRFLWATAVILRFIPAAAEDELEMKFDRSPQRKPALRDGLSMPESTTAENSGLATSGEHADLGLRDDDARGDAVEVVVEGQHKEGSGGGELWRSGAINHT